MAANDLISPTILLPFADDLAGIITVSQAAIANAATLSASAGKQLYGDPANPATTPGLGYQGATIRRYLDPAMVAPNTGAPNFFGVGLLQFFTPQQVLGPVLANVLAAVDQDIIEQGQGALGTGVYSLDTFLSYYNAPAIIAPYGPFSTLFPPEAAQAYLWAKGAGSMLSAANVFVAGPLYLGVWTRNGSVWSNTTTVPYYVTASPAPGGGSINAGALRGNVPGSQLQGYSAGVLKLLVDTPPPSGNTWALTITGAGQDSTGADHAGGVSRTWTITIDSTYLPGQTVIVPPTMAGDRIRSISGVTAVNTGTGAQGQARLYVDRQRTLPGVAGLPGVPGGLLLPTPSWSWYRADMGVFQAVGSPAAAGQKVAIWQDQSGWGHDLTVRIGATPPSLAVDTVTNEVGVYFGAAATDEISNGLNPGGPTTSLLVARFTGSGATQMWGDGTEFLGIYGIDYMAFQPGQTIDSGTGEDLALHLHTFYSGGTLNPNGYYQVDLKASHTSNNQNAFNNFMISNQATQPFSGYVYEVMVFQGQLSLTQIANLQTYLRTKWGTP